MDFCSFIINPVWLILCSSSDAPPWCSPARNLLEAHLRAAKRHSHAIIAHKLTRSNRRHLPDAWKERLLAWSAVGGSFTPNLDNLSVATILAFPLEAVARTRAAKPIVLRKPVYVGDLMA